MRTIAGWSAANMLRLGFFELWVVHHAVYFVQIRKVTGIIGHEGGEFEPVVAINGERLVKSAGSFVKRSHVKLALQACEFTQALGGSGNHVQIVSLGIHL